MALGFHCYGVTLAGAHAASSPAVVAVSVAVFGVVLGVSMPAVDASISECVEQRYRAGLFGLRNGTAFLGRATGPVAFAAAATVAGYRPVLGVAAVGVFAVAAAPVAVTRPPAATLDPELSA